MLCTQIGHFISVETETFGDVFICLVKTGFSYQTGHSCGNSVIDSKLDRRERENSFVQIFGYLSDNNCTDSFNSKFSYSLKSFARFKLWIFVLPNLKTNYL